MRNTLAKRRELEMGAQMKALWLVTSTLILGLMCGCAATATSPTSNAASQQPLTTSRPAAAVATAASVPSLVFADPVGIPSSADAQPAVGSRPATSTYKPFLSGEHIDSVKWEATSVNDTTQTALVIGLDRQGTTILAGWTKAHVGGNMLVLVDGRVLSMGQVVEPISSGSLQLSAGDAASMRKLLDPAIVRTK